MKNNFSLRAALENDCGSKSIAKNHINPSMPEQPVTPPAYMWDRIEKILDHQDQQRLKEKKNEKLPSGQKPRSRSIFYAAFGVTILAGIFLITH